MNTTFFHHRVTETQRKSQIYESESQRRGTAFTPIESLIFMPFSVPL